MLKNYLNIGYCEESDDRVRSPMGIDYFHLSGNIHFWRFHREGPSSSGASYHASDINDRFHDFFESTKSFWFIPYIERMANGEDVPLEEIKQAYRDNNDGREIEEVT